MKASQYILICILYSVLCVLLVGCRPKGILSSREMRELLVDIHKTDGMLQVSGWRGNDNEVKDIYYAQVLERHGITQAQFDSSLVWYTAHPQFFNKIYPKVLKDLAAEDAAFNEQYAEELAGRTEDLVVPKLPPSTFTRNDLDSTLWVMQNGHSNSWKSRPLMHNFVYQLLP